MNPGLAAAIADSVTYLESDAARTALELDGYWPKWHAPWWHMLLLHEMGETARIPDVVIPHYVAALNRIPVKIFPIKPGDLPPGTDPARGTPCHCQLGNVYQVLAARGVDVDRELPWIRPWFLRYQMADGGMNCDESAYLAEGECPSSMVGTIAAFEAVLLHTKRPWTTAERAYLDKGAAFLAHRELRLGSATRHNAAEQTSALEWVKLCFPRFYLYDVLRGLSALLDYVERTKERIPAASFRVVHELLDSQFGDGPVRIGRRSFAGVRTIKPTASGVWTRQDADVFPLLDAVSRVGEDSAFLTRQWHACRERMIRSC